MKVWHKDARFCIFTECDVFISDGGNYMYVENEPYSYEGDYVCRVYQQGRNLDGTFFYMLIDNTHMSGDRVNKLEKAQWDIARDIIERDLAIWQIHEYNNGNAEDVELIEDARRSLMEDAKYGEIFHYC